MRRRVPPVQTLLAAVLPLACNAITGAADLEVGEPIADGGSGDAIAVAERDGSPDASPDGAGPVDGGVDADSEPGRDKIVFVTSATYTGNLGGAAGADQKCTSLALSAGRSGLFVAWLSTSANTTQSNAITRLLREGPWRLTTGELVAADKATLTSMLSHPIDRDEKGAPAPGPSAWTGTGSDGRFFYGDCAGWRSSSATKDAAVGSTSGVSPSTNPADNGWTAQSPGKCDELRPIYCFQF